MKKTRFFNGKQIFLAVLLAWLALLAKAFDLRVAFREAAVPEEEIRPAERQTGAEEETFSSGDAGIRVVLMDTDYRSYYHPSVTVVCSGREYTYTADSPELEAGPRVLEGGADGLTVTSIERSEGAPVYRGSLEITKRPEGLVLVNTLPLETYLEAVVPSEMPASYEPEALKAQAVCARTYACRQIEEGRMGEFGADVDDSVNCQVYADLAPQPAASRAVRDTEGLVLRQGGALIEAYYFSTSAGMTSTDEIWGAEEAAGYLQSVPCTFDAEYPWSQWNVVIPWERLTETVHSLLGETGVLRGLEITRKSQSGAVTGLRAVTEGNVYTVSGEYDVRRLLSPRGLTVTEKDGSGAEGGELLPSAYFAMETSPGISVEIQGRGYGHGVGMSQNAANEMARQGSTFEEILRYFYRDVEISGLAQGER